MTFIVNPYAFRDTTVITCQLLLHAYVLCIYDNLKSKAYPIHNLVNTCVVSPIPETCVLRRKKAIFWVLVSHFPANPKFDIMSHINYGHPILVPFSLAFLHIDFKSNFLNILP